MFRNIGKLLSILLIFIMCILFIPTSSYANESNINNTTRDVSEVISVLRENEVPEDKIDILVKKFLNNELWDCFKEEYKEIKPQIKSKNFEKTIYPDGSFKILKTEIVDVDKPHVVPYMDAVDYTYGYRVSKNLGLVGMAYTVDFAQDRARNMGKILSQYDRDIWLIGGTYSNMKSGYWPDWRKPTHAWMSADLQTFGGYGSTFGWVKFYVDGQSYWIDWQ